MLMLTREREQNRWSRSELARRARMTPADVGKIECGRLRPYDSQLRKLARALGVSVSQAHGLLAPVREEAGGRCFSEAETRP